MTTVKPAVCSRQTAGSDPVCFCARRLVGPDDEGARDQPFSLRRGFCIELVSSTRL